ncbi:hypothetical protein CkaCkLH20_09157 [Colletotrichum karsti]|uniref:Uncharacterized protein n=1 Tax=Colletotrichum karsti TaxID=1095194 RepID=A0A9P6LEN1_9PEZI|nr:uncharacterized protein CkaCkLH20_09157 [Colletotrichum karsti]KAF9873344.1 hypothetical protein CkaCkLH20_09157 [Colletotrichum karsti]
MPPKKTVIAAYNLPDGFDPDSLKRPQEPAISPEHSKWEQALYSMSVVQSYISNENRRLRDLNGRTYKLYSRTIAEHDSRLDLGVNELVFQAAAAAPPSSEGSGEEGSAKYVVAKIVLAKDAKDPAARKYLEIGTEPFMRPKVASGKNVAVRATAWEVGGGGDGEERELVGGGPEVPENVATVDMWFVSKGFVRLRVHQDLASPEGWEHGLKIDKFPADRVQKYRIFAVCEAFVEEDREVRRISMVGKEEPPDQIPISNGRMVMYEGKMRQATHEYCPPGWDDLWEGEDPNSR